MDSHQPHNKSHLISVQSQKFHKLSRTILATSQISVPGPHPYTVEKFHQNFYQIAHYNLGMSVSKSFNKNSRMLWQFVKGYCQLLIIYKFLTFHFNNCY